MTINPSFKNSIFFLYSIILLIVQIVLYLADSLQGYTAMHSCILFLTYIQVVLYLYNCYKKEKKIFSFWVRPSYILLLSLLIVNTQFTLDIWMGLAAPSDTLEEIGANYFDFIGKATTFSCIGISTFLIGNSLSFKKRMTNVDTKTDEHKRIYSVAIWVILSIICFAFWVINIDIFSFITAANYSGSGAWNRESTPFAVFESLFGAFSIIVIAIVTHNNIVRYTNSMTLGEYIKSYPKTFWIVMLLYLLLRLVSGDRGPVLYTGMAFFYSYILSSKTKVRLLPILLIIIVGAFALNRVNIIRSMSNEEETFAQKFVRSFEVEEELGKKSTFIPLTHELAKSFGCNVIAINDIHTGKTDYKYGLYNLSELLVGIPGFNRITTTLLGWDIYRYNTAEYLTISCLGEHYSYGLGSTCLVDFFLDFGLLGVIIGMILIGILFRYIDYRMLQYPINVILLLFILKLSSQSIYIPRASFSFTICGILYAVIIYIVIQTIYSFVETFILNKGIVRNENTDIS